MSTAPEREQPERPGEPALVRKLRARQAEHKQRGRLYRLMFVAAGLLVLGAGIAMLALPGPAFVVIPIGLAILSLEFTWAERLLERALIKGEEAKRKAAQAAPLPAGPLTRGAAPTRTAAQPTPAQKILSGLAVACAAAAALTAALVWDIPYLPV